MTFSTFEMPRLPSIGDRLARALIGASVLWVLAMSATAWVAIGRQVSELADAGLQESGELLYGLMVSVEQPLRSPEPHDALPAPAHAEKVIWQRVGPDGRVLLRSHHAPITAFFDQPTMGLANAGGIWRVYGLPLPNDQGILYVADRLSDRREAYLDAAWGLLAVTVLLGVVFLFGLRHLVRRELRPLQTLSDAVSSYDPSKAGATLPRAQRQELALIRKAVIELGHRLTRRIANERAFSAHAAHALRTPLAGMDAQLAMALRECGHNERPRLVQTREAARRLSRVVSSLLTLFRSGIETQWQKADLETLLDKVALDDLSIRFIGSVDVEADPDLLIAALVNLLDNVVRHGGNRVTIQVEMTTRFQVITLTDNGPGVTADRLAALQSALDSQHYGGHTGLGLMMAGMVARAHGGTLRISNLEVGMAAELTLRRMPNP